MIHIKHFTHLAEGSVDVWKIFETSLPRPEVSSHDDPKQRAEQASRRLKRVLDDLKSKYGEILELDGANSAVKARMLVDAILCLERMDGRNILDREDKSRLSQLAREFNSAFESLRESLGDDGLRQLSEVFHFPARIAGLNEFIKLRRDSVGMSSREIGLRSRMEAAQAEVVEARKYHNCMEAFLRVRRAKGLIGVGLVCLMVSIVSLDASRILGAILGLNALLLLVGAVFSWISGSVVMSSVGEEIRLKVSGLDQGGFVSVGERLKRAEDEVASLEKRLEDHRAELSSINDRIAACVEIEPTWRVMNEAELEEQLQRISSRAREVFGEKGSAWVFNNQRLLSRY